MLNDIPKVSQPAWSRAIGYTLYYAHYPLSKSLILPLFYEKCIYFIPALMLGLKPLSRYICPYYYHPGWLLFTPLLFEEIGTEVGKLLSLHIGSDL